MVKTQTKQNNESKKAGGFHGESGEREREREGERQREGRKQLNSIVISCECSCKTNRSRFHFLLYTLGHKALSSLILHHPHHHHPSYLSFSPGGFNLLDEETDGTGLQLASVDSPSSEVVSEKQTRMKLNPGKRDCPCRIHKQMWKIFIY
ncbi:hypothetical protein DNTS_022900 [Danionella cerebrum]|uniref:Uncharacterized protein n=1 Tax=Danionella cerebrum TaxID=2873325 RepID=A0A553QNG8_9TELE|nr:hypothetical protein DNTS_022900 [Danionella translucida]